jgi:ABC-type multidrug transport system, ATPase component
MGEEVIKTYNINKYFRDFHAVNNVNLSINRGEIFGFIGKNGAGKTTIMRIITGLMKADTGKVEILGREMDNRSMLSLKSKIAFMPQNVRFDDSTDAGSILRFFSALRGCSSTDSIKFAGDLNIDLNRKVKYFSPGQQKKLQLAIATIGSPEILILDEPTAGLDPVGVQQVRDVTRKLNSNGSTVFISSHILNELDNLCSSVAVIDHGKILYQGKIQKSYEFEISNISVDGVQRIGKAFGGGIEYSNGKLYAEVSKEKVPDLVHMLNGAGASIYGIKRQGLEVFYNNIAQEAVGNE